MGEWQRARYGAVASNVRKRIGTEAGRAELLSVTATSGVVSQSQSGRRDTSAIDKSKYLMVEPGDVAYNTMRMWQGVSGYSEMQGIVSPAYTVVRPSSLFLDGRFLAHLMKLPSNINQYRTHSQGLVSDTWNLKFASLADLRLDLPPLEEQRQIAEILDAIDETIRAIERVIDKLELQRQAVSQATFGVTSWRITRNIVPVERVLACPPKNGQSCREAASWSGAFMLGLGCLTESGFAPRQLKWSPRIDDSLCQALLADGDLLMSRSNTADRVGYIGRYVSVGEPCIYPDLMMRLVPREQVLARYLELALQSEPARSQIRVLASGTSGSMLKITGESVTRLCVPICSLANQERLCAAFDVLASRRNVEELRLSKLRDIRSGLAADLLSGRVRTVTA